MSIQKYIDYISFEKKYSDHTVLAYQKDLEMFQSFCDVELNELPILKANESEIRTWIVYLIESGISNRTVNRKISTLNGYYKFLKRTGNLETNPLVNHKVLKTPKRILIPFSSMELEQVFSQIDVSTFEGLRNKLMIEVFYTTGMRREELIGLNLHSFDWGNNVVKVLGKRNKERFLPLIPSLKKSLLHYVSIRKEMNPKDDSFFITSKGNKIYGTLVYRIINTYFSRVSKKVKKSPHVIRHSFATHLLDEGADLNSVKELLGHSSLAATQVYTHTSLDHLKQVYNNAHPRSKKL
jgi:integrase/recombinase XerC